jgi:hypothetical protein
MLEILIREVRLTLGVVYGPNYTDRGFYQMVEDKIRQWGNQVVFGGDFNTIICRDSGTQNIDWDRAGRVPNFQNSNIINGWIEDGLLLNPFRTLYHEMREICYVSIRGRDERGGGGLGED